MEPYNSQNNHSFPPGKVFFRIGLSLSVMLILMNVLQIAALTAAELFIAPSSPYWNWISWIVLAVSFYCISMPVFYLMTRKLPDGPREGFKKMPVSHFLILFTISMGASYLANIAGTIFNYMIRIPLGTKIEIPATDMIARSETLPVILFACILSPIVEEFIFRKILVDKTRLYGDKTAIWISAFTFALFHGNLSQFFYALVLGMIFAYITIKTNTVLYAVLLHILVNLFGSTLIPALTLNWNMLFAPLAGLILLFFIFAGIIFFAFNVKNIHLDPPTEPIERSVRFRTIYGNAGMLIFIILSVLLILYVIFAPFINQFIYAVTG